MAIIGNTDLIADELQFNQLSNIKQIYNDIDFQ